MYIFNLFKSGIIINSWWNVKSFIEKTFVHREQHGVSFILLEQQAKLAML